MSPLVTLLLRYRRLWWSMSDNGVTLLLRCLRLWWSMSPLATLLLLMMRVLQVMMRRPRLCIIHRALQVMMRRLQDMMRRLQVMAHRLQDMMRRPHLLLLLLLVASASHLLSLLWLCPCMCTCGLPSLCAQSSRKRSGPLLATRVACSTGSLLRVFAITSWTSTFGQRSPRASPARVIARLRCGSQAAAGSTSYSNTGLQGPSAP